MNISKLNLCLLIENYIKKNIKDDNPRATAKGVHNFYYENLSTEFWQDKQALEIHFKYYSTCKDPDVGIDGEEMEEVYLVLSAMTNQSLDNLSKLEKESYIDKMCIYNIIEILKDL